MLKDIDLNQVLHNNIKFIRLLSGKKQQDFAKELGITRDQLYTYENGKANPNEFILLKLANIAAVSLEDLLTKDLKNRTVNVINPDTKKVEFTLAPNGANQLEKELQHLRELLKAEKEKNELLKQLVERGSKKS